MPTRFEFARRLCHLLAGDGIVRKRQLSWPGWRAIVLMGVLSPLGCFGQTMDAAGTANPTDTSAATGAPDQSPDQTQQPPLPVSPLMNQPASSTTLAVPVLAFPNTYDSSSPQAGNQLVYEPGQYDISQVATRSELNYALGAQLNGSENEAESGVLFQSIQSPLKPLRLGPIVLKAAVSSNVVEDDNIFVQNTRPVSDTIITITPAIKLEYGDLEGQKATASLTYAPSFQRYLRNASQNSDDQYVFFTGSYPFSAFSLSAAQNYSRTTGIDQDSHARLTEENYISTVGVNIPVDDKLAIGTSFNRVMSDYVDGGGINNTTYSNETTAEYKLTDKVTLNPGLVTSYDLQEGGPNELSEAATVNATYVPTLKVTVYGGGGVEFDHYDNGGNTTNPTFRLGVSYVPFDSTAADLSGFQTVRNSTQTSNQTVVETGVGFTVRQRFLHMVYLSVNTTYQQSKYSNAGTTTGTATEAPPVTNGPTSAMPTGARTEDDLIIRPSLSVNPTDWSSLNLYYEYEDVTSSEMSSTYRDHQMGVSLTMQF